MHEKLGFIGVARAKEWWGLGQGGISFPLICAVWQGSGEVELKGSVFASLEPWSKGTLE